MKEYAWQRMCAHDDKDLLEELIANIKLLYPTKWLHDFLFFISVNENSEWMNFT